MFSPLYAHNRAREPDLFKHAARSSVFRGGHSDYFTKAQIIETVAHTRPGGFGRKSLSPRRAPYYIAEIDRVEPCCRAKPQLPLSRRRSFRSPSIGKSRFLLYFVNPNQELLVRSKVNGLPSPICLIILRIAEDLEGGTQIIDRPRLKY